MRTSRLTLHDRRYELRRHWALFLLATMIQLGMLAILFLFCTWQYGLFIFVCICPAAVFEWRVNDDFLQPILKLVLGEPTRFSIFMLATVIPALVMVLFAAFGVLVIVCSMYLMPGCLVAVFCRALGADPISSYIIGLLVTCYIFVKAWK